MRVVKFIDLQAQRKRISVEIDEAIRRVLDAGSFIGGREVAALETELAEFCGAAYCISCGNGTDALQLALMAAGVSRDDEVIVPTFNYIATAEAVAMLGARPVFVDVLPDTYNVDPRGVEAAITSHTKAIVPVSMFGQCPDFDELLAIGKRYGIVVIEDAAQSFGALYRGRPSGNIADISCTSFYPSKPIACYGDGGAVFTNDSALADRVRKIANHGQSRRYHHEVLGMNSRLDTIQAAIVRVKLSVFDDEIERRQQVASTYRNLLTEAGFAAPHVHPHNRSVFAQYTIEVDQRARVCEGLKAKDVPYAIHYPAPLHRQPAVRDDTVLAPVAERLTERVLSLPMHPYLSLNDCKTVVYALIGACKPDAVRRKVRA
jgi:UDP-2-acetamido-2-deoxy-ribo-hexuluronate aminotransferase